jgi:hypothetical protein
LIGQKFLHSVGIVVGGLYCFATYNMNAHASPDNLVKVFLLAGQSNMAGRAPGDQVGENGNESKVLFDYVCSFPARKGVDGPPEPHCSNGWISLGVSPKHINTPGSHFGPEIGFGRALVAHSPEQPMAIIKHGRGATSLAEDWAVDATEGKQLYREFIRQTHAALARLEKDGQSYVLEALVWCQGEADTTRREWAENYGENLRHFFAGARTDLGVPELPVLIVLTGDGHLNAKMTETDLVRSAQMQFVKEDPNAALVSGDDLTLLDVVHYDAAAQLTLGKRLAEAYHKLKSSDQP